MKKIGILGCSNNSINMGCVALHHSLLLLLEKISVEIDEDFHYYIFDVNYLDSESLSVSHELRIPLDLLHYYSMPCEVVADSVKDHLRRCKHYFSNRKMYSIISECDLVIDLTQGDSFSDIYGEERFFQWTIVKDKIERMGVPLVLGPQTYGPFIGENVRRYAKRVIENAALVISRDVSSAAHVKEFCSKEISIGTDLAFGLPYVKNEITSRGKVKIGINPSGLLSSIKNDNSAMDHSKLTVDYDFYIRELIRLLLNKGDYEVHLVPHVGNEAIDCFGGIEGVCYHEAFTSPIDAKNVISSMDIFVGARMHSTIAAFSSGVSTIPTAYSMKFSGVFEGVGYPFVIDLTNMETGDAVKKTIEYVEDYSTLKTVGHECVGQIQSKYENMKITLKDFISCMK